MSFWSYILDPWTTGAQNIYTLVHLPFGRSLRYLVIRPLEEWIPSHEDQSIGAKTIWGLALWGAESREPQFSLKPSFGT